MTIAIIGAGWTGVITALELKKQGHDVVLFEKNEDICLGVSGKYGLRIHAGPHYSRSQRTRESCREGLDVFLKEHSEFVVPLEAALYGLGTIDVNGDTSKVDNDVFNAVCREFPGAKSVEPTDFGFENLISLFDMDEPAAIVGERLRQAMWKLLKKVDIEVVCKYSIETVECIANGKFSINNEREFDHVVNATYYQSLLPRDSLPFNIEVVYQPCITLRYKDKQATEKRFHLR